MIEPNIYEDSRPTVPETRFYKWEEVPNLRMPEIRVLFKMRINAYSGKSKEAHSMVLDRLETLWSKRGFDSFPTERLKAMLVAAAKDLGWHHTNHAPDYRKPAQPDDPNLKTCPTCGETKPKSHFMRIPSARRARQYGWREDTRIKTPHERCNYCASPKRNSIAPKNTTPTIAKLRKQINEKIKVAKRMEDSAYKELKIKLLEQCRERVCDYLIRGVRGPDSWEMMLSKQEKEELEALHRRVHWTRRTPAVF